VAVRGPGVTYSPGVSVQTTPAARATTRSQCWREGSRAEHEAAESSAFVSEVMAGRVSAAGYAAYLRRLRVVYAALERALDRHRDHPAIAAVDDRALRRLAALEADLRHWTGDAGVGPAPVGVSPVAEAYRARIEAVARVPHLLLAHHYTRYLGDLSGGQVLARALRRGFPDRSFDDGGLDFYAFGQIAAPVPWKRAYRERLDGLELDTEQDAALLAEVREAFRLNHALLDEVAATEPGAGG
jgi:heme oxygenase (biliverdin-producing, ferredoxin)